MADDGEKRQIAMSDRYRVVVMIVLMLAVVISALGCTQVRSNRIDGCPIVLAYIDDTNAGYSIEAYEAARGIQRTVGFYRLQGGDASITYYDNKSDCWFVEEDKVISKRTVKICGKKTTPVKTTESSLEQPSFNSDVKNGKLSVSFLNEGGSLASKRELSVPGASIVDCSSMSWSPENGCIAAELLLKNATESQLYLFDRNSHLMARLGRGSSPQFVAGGRRLIYQDMSWARSSDEEIKPSKLGTGNAVIYDISAHTKRVVDVVHSPGAVLDGVADCIGSSDGNWLVCSYAKYPAAERTVFVVDIRNGGTKWHRLPISVYDGQWILLDTMPKRFLK